MQPTTVSYCKKTVENNRLGEKPTLVRLGLEVQQYWTKTGAMDLNTDYSIIDF